MRCPIHRPARRSRIRGSRALLALVAAIGLAGAGPGRAGSAPDDPIRLVAVITPEQASLSVPALSAAAIAQLATGAARPRIALLHAATPRGRALRDSLSSRLRADGAGLVAVAHLPAAGGRGALLGVLARIAPARPELLVTASAVGFPPALRDLARSLPGRPRLIALAVE